MPPSVEIYISISSGSEVAEYFEKYISKFNVKSVKLEVSIIGDSKYVQTNPDDGAISEVAIIN